MAPTETGDAVRLRIISDGTPMGTKIVDQHDRLVKNVAAVQWVCNSGDQLLATPVTR